MSQTVCLSEKEASSCEQHLRGDTWLACQHHLLQARTVHVMTQLLQQERDDAFSDASNDVRETLAKVGGGGGSNASFDEVASKCHAQ